MSKVTLTKKAQAAQAGYRASVANRPRVPAQCAIYCNLIEGFAIGEGGAELAQDWLDGYQKRCDEEAADILARP